jgi:LysM repeat protein
MPYAPPSARSISQIVRGVTAASKAAQGARKAGQTAKRVSSGSQPRTISPQVAKGANYSVQAGNTLSSIAKAMGTTVAAIMAANPSIRNPNQIQIGQQIANPVALAAQKAAAQAKAVAAAKKASQVAAAKAAAQRAAQIAGAKKAATTAKAVSKGAATLAGAAKVGAAAKAVAANRAPTTTTRTSGGVSTGGTGTRPAGVSSPTGTKTSTGTVSKPAPAPAPVINKGNPATNAGTFTTSRGGPGTFGRFQRERLSRGPRGSTSITPEMLRRIALRRIGGS